jgi:hypothetical protein
LAGSNGIGISRKQKISNKYYLQEFLIPHGIGITRKQKISNKYYLHEFLIPHGIGITRKQKIRYHEELGIREGSIYWQEVLTL